MMVLEAEGCHLKREREGIGRRLSLVSSAETR